MKDSEMLEALKLRHAESAFLEAGGRPGGADDLSFFSAVWKLHGDRLRFNPVGELEAVDQFGVRKYSPKEPTRPMSAVEYFQTLRAAGSALSHCFDPKPVRGGKPAQPANPAPKQTPEEPVQLSRSEQLARARRSGQQPRG
jgi:hypothetical protein